MTTQSPGGASIPYSSPAGPPRKMSKSSLLSLICGILGCVPFAMGALAILLGIVGIVRTGSPLKKGRWMAIVGILLGLVSVVSWSVAASTFGAGWAIWSSLKAPAIAAQSFVQDVADGDLAAAKGLETGLDDSALQAIQQDVSAHGKFVDTKFSSFNINNDLAECSGTATFDTGNYDIDVHLQKTDSWRVTQFTLSPDKQ